MTSDAITRSNTSAARWRCSPRELRHSNARRRWRFSDGCEMSPLDSGEWRRASVNCWPTVRLLRLVGLEGLDDPGADEGLEVVEFCIRVGRHMRECRAVPIPFPPLAPVPERPKGAACKAVQSRVQIPPGARQFGGCHIVAAPDTRSSPFRGLWWSSFRGVIRSERCYSFGFRAVSSVG